MITKPTVLILGAGASKPYGFPTGPELKNLVLERFQSRSEDLYKEFEYMGFDRSTVTEFCDALHQSGVKSVDAFLEHRTEFVGIGKTAISEALIPYEEQSRLFGRGADWYGHLLDALNSPMERFQENLLSVLTFNYDRSLEWYLYRALRARFGISTEQAVALLGELPIVHLYGTLGGRPWERGARPYEPSGGRKAIYASRDSIKIIHEDVRDDPEFGRAILALTNAQRIVFLGFGYSRINIQRLHPEMWKRVETPLRGSAFGLTDLEKAYAKKSIGHSIEFGNEDWDVLRFLREKVPLEPL